MDSKSSLIYLTKWAPVLETIASWRDQLWSRHWYKQWNYNIVVINHQLCMFLWCLHANVWWQSLECSYKYSLCLMLIHATQVQHIKGGCAEAQTCTQEVPLRGRELHWGHDLELTLTWGEWRHWVPKGKASILDVRVCTELLSDIC